MGVLVFVVFVGDLGFVVVFGASNFESLAGAVLLPAAVLLLVTRAGSLGLNKKSFAAIIV